MDLMVVERKRNPKILMRMTDKKEMKKMINRYKRDAKETVDEMMSRVADITYDDWIDFQKHGIDF